MGKWGFYGMWGCLAVLSSGVGCANIEAGEGTTVGAAQALVGVDEFLYLRCNATGWNADSGNLLTSAGQSGVYAVEYDVTAGYMVTGGDQCVITRTNSANGWGSSSASFGAATAGVVTAPGQWSIGAADSTPVTIKYPALGRYRTRVDWAARTVTITAVNTTPPPASEYYYLRCNATSWGVGSSNRLTPTAGQLALTYNVDQAWMVSNGDQCVVTRTDQLNGWGTTQATLGTSAATTVVVPVAGAASTQLIPAGQQFTVRYPAVGQYQATFNPGTGELRMAVPGPAVPETGLHGAVESLGDNRVRVTYDFESSAQLQDFVTTNADATAVSLANGQLLVQNIASTETINTVKLTKGFRIDSLRYRATLQAGNHINVYVGTVWDGGWNPTRGYGVIHRADGRLFVTNNSETVPSSAGVVQGVTYDGLIETTTQGITWTLDGVVQSNAVPYYGGTSRTLALGGYGSTVAFDSLVLEGIVEGMESDGVETDPSVIHGTVTSLPDNRVRISYDFADPQQKYDFVASSASTRREIHEGRLVVSRANDLQALKIALYKYNLHVDRLSYQAELLAGNHVNAYMNTIWDGAWAPAVGCAGVHRYDGRFRTNNGVVTWSSDTTPVALRTAYTAEFSLAAGSLSWVLNGTAETLDDTCYTGTDGTVGLGGYDSDVAFDNITLEGTLE